VDDIDSMEIDLLDSRYPSDHYITKMPSWHANIYTSLTTRLIAMVKLVSESVTRDCLVSAVFAKLVAQY
jgi:hypothetical protein